MSNEMNAFLEKFSAAERASGTMTTFQSLGQEEQMAMLEWARATCMQISVYIEKQTFNKSAESGTLPVLKFHAEIALKVGMIHAIARENNELLAGCEAAYRHVFGDAKMKVIDEFKHVVKLFVQLSRW